MHVREQTTGSADDAIDTQSLFLDHIGAEQEAAACDQVSYLFVIEAQSSRVVPLPREGSFIIGRGANADLVLNQRAVSRAHARITCEGGVLRITDLGSHNGTYVGGEKINSTRELHAGDQVVISGAKLVVHAPPEKQQPPAPPLVYARDLAHAPRTVEIGPAAAIVFDPQIEELYALIERLAASDLPVLVCGETGSGKELAANALHHWSKRKARPLVALNCAALPESLFESELFGHDEGAFSGAKFARAGLFELASGGTLLLDEVGELPLSVQPKLLRVLETQRVARLGQLGHERAIDVRIVAATNRDLRQEVRAGRFRQDLYFRLGAATLEIPALRDRPGEIPVLARAFLDDACRRLARPALVISDEALLALLEYTWPGNIRELKNTMDYAAAAVAQNILSRAALEKQLHPREPAAPSREGTPRRSPSGTFRPIQEELEEIERDRMAAALKATNGHQKRAAELIAMPLRTFVAKLEKYQLRSQRRAGERSLPPDGRALEPTP